MGGSAGGLEAFGQFFAHMPPDAGMAFVLVPHLDPTHKALLAELLQRSTPMKVAEVEDGVLVRPNAVYVIPPNADLSILHGKLHLLEPAAPRGLRMPIDFFFRQLALDQQEKAIGIVLSGMGSDGTLGLRAIKEHGGLVMVQDPASAKYDAMPHCAINSGLVDLVAMAEELPARLIQCLAHTPVLPQEPLPTDEGSVASLQKVFVLLRAHTGNDFSCYKRTTILRRIERRMSVHQLDSLARYVRFLREYPQEVDLLYKELLIGVTNFFRDPGLYSFLKETALPVLLPSHADGRPLRVWTAACSTGEETYSLAIVIKESLEDLNLPYQPAIQIFATDIDKDAIEKARQGTYSARIATDVSPQRLKRFFVHDGEGYRIGHEIREMTIFAPQNLLVDPPFTKLDILCCRNFLIYVNSETQKKLLPLLHYALGPGGLLILGSAESIGTFAHLLSPLDHKWKVFQRQETAQRPSIEMPAPQLPRELAPHPATGRIPEPALDIPYAAQRALLDAYAPPSVVINPEGDIVYVNGRTGKYLEPSSGKVNVNVFAMAREGLREELGTAIRKARKEKGPVTVSGVRVKTDGGHTAINLTVKPLAEPATMRGVLLLVFEEVAPAVLPASGRKKRVFSPPATPVAEVEEQLLRAQELLQTTVEEKEATQEELHSANEELQSNNEELQSTNEELTTSKEELQSLNEELQTVNAELQGKLDELSQSNNDMTNLLNGIEIATIFLDNRLCVKRFTPQATRIVNLIASDVGRPLTDLVTKLKYDHLVDDARQVLGTLVPKEAEVQGHDGRWYRVRVLPYRTSDNMIDGVVSTFADITAMKETEAELRKARRLAESIIATIREPLVALDGELRIVSASRSFYGTFGLTSAQTQGRLIYEVGQREWDIPALKELLGTILPRDATFENFCVEHDFPNTGHKILLLNARRVPLENGTGADLILLAMEDVTESSQPRTSGG
jgi:chemotaxis methyl-accepting protein methylase